MKSLLLVGMMFLMTACGTSGLKNHLSHSGISVKQEIIHYDSEVNQILHSEQAKKLSYLGPAPASQGN